MVPMTNHLEGIAMRCVLAFIVAVLTVSTALAGGKPLPKQPAIDSAKQLIADAYRKELSAADKAPAVKAMLETAATTDGDDPAQAALYLSAAEIAARTGDTRLAFDAVDRLAGVFDVDALALKESFLEMASKSAKTNDARVSVANRGLEIADLAMAANRMDVAESALKTSGISAAKVRDASLRKDIAAKRKELERAKKHDERAESELAAAKRTLSDNPHDPKANEALGKYLAFERNDWSTGLKHLAKSSDPGLRTLATSDMQGPGNAKAAAVLGDSWYFLGEQSDSARDKAGFRSRAAFWYTRALVDLKGFAKTRVEKRLSEMQDALAAAASQDGGENGKYIDVTLAPGVLMRLVKIPASADGKIPEFYLGQTEVTQKQWMAVMGSNPSAVKGMSLPVTDVSQKDCMDFAERLSGKGRFAFRLPTKEEWMHAYDLDVKTDGGNVSTVAWHKSNGLSKVHDVAQKSGGKLGLFDIAGNVFELTSDPTHIYGGSVGVDIATNGDCFVQDFPSGDKHQTVGFRVSAIPR